MLTVFSPRHGSVLFAVLGSGFTSQIAHAGAPPFQMYTLKLHLPRNVFIGTSAIFFCIVNWMKVPAFVALKQLTHENLSTAAALLPLAFISTIVGVWIVRRVPTARFYVAIFCSMILIGLKLLWDGGYYLIKIA